MASPGDSSNTPSTPSTPSTGSSSSSSPPANTNRKTLATVSRIEVFEYDEFVIGSTGTQVPAAQADAIITAAKKQNVELTELTN